MVVADPYMVVNGSYVVVTYSYVVVTASYTVGNNPYVVVAGSYTVGNEPYMVINDSYIVVNSSYGTPTPKINSSTTGNPFRRNSGNRFSGITPNQISIGFKSHFRQVPFREKPV